MNMSKKPNNTVTMVRNVCMSFVASVSACFLASIILAAYNVTYEQNELYLMSRGSQIFMIILFPVCVILTVTLVYLYFDNLDLFNKREYFEGKDKSPLISRKPYLVGFAISMLFSTLTFSAGYHMMLRKLFGEINPTWSRLLAVATMAILRLVQLYLLQDKWESEIKNPLFAEKSVFKRNRDMYTFKPHQMIFQPIGYLALATITCYFAGWFVFPLFAVCYNIITNPDLWWTVFSFPIIIIILIYALRFIHNTRKRRILLKRLKQIEREKLARVKINGSKLLSATFTFLPFTIEITDNEGEKYNCLVISASKINAPMFFKPDEYLVEHGAHLRGGALLSKAPGYMGAAAIDLQKLGGKENPTNMVFGFRMAHKFKFSDAEGHKVVILSPTPTTAFSLEGREFKPIDTGEVIGDYTIYTATGLFNHLERQDRKHKRLFGYDY